MTPIFTVLAEPDEDVAVDPEPEPVLREPHALTTRAVAASPTTSRAVRERTIMGGPSLSGETRRPTGGTGRRWRTRPSRADQLLIWSECRRPDPPTPVGPPDFTCS